MARTKSGDKHARRRSLSHTSGESVNNEIIRREPTPSRNSTESIVRETSNTNQNTNETERSSRKTRGPTMGIMKPKPGEIPMLVHIVGHKFLEDEARSKTRVLFQKRFKVARTKFEQWPKDEIDLLWTEYLKYFRFASKEEEKRARIIWEENTRKSYPNYLWRWKDQAIKKYGSIEKARDKKPSWTTLQVWQSLCDYWLSEEFKKSSELRKRNREKATYIPHTTGSIPYAVRREQERKRLRRAPTQYEMYKETHTRKKKDSDEKEWISEEAKQKWEKYGEMLKAKHGDTNKPLNELDDPDLEVWQEAVGGVKKGRLVGRPGEKWSSRRGSVCGSLLEEQNSAQIKKIAEYITYMHQFNKAMAEKLQVDPPVEFDDFFASSNAADSIAMNSSDDNVEDKDENSVEEDNDDEDENSDREGDDDEDENSDEDSEDHEEESF